MPALRPRREVVLDAALRPRFAPVILVLRLAPLALVALLRARLAPLLRLLLAPPFATTRERLVLALLRVERDFDAAADFVRPPAFLRAPAFAAGRPRFAAPRFAPALAVVLLVLLAPVALRPRLVPVLERARRPALARPLRRRGVACAADPSPCELIASVSSWSSNMTDCITLDWSSQGMVISC